jgi:hypothetical protein
VTLVLARSWREAGPCVSLSAPSKLCFVDSPAHEFGDYRALVLVLESAVERRLHIGWNAEVDDCHDPPTVEEFINSILCWRDGRSSAVVQDSAKFLVRVSKR